MKIAILTLTGQRDKYIDDLLAEQLREYGHTVTVRNYIYSGKETVCYEKPDVVIHPMAGGQYKYDFIQKCKEWGVEVIVRRGEAGMGRTEFDTLSDNRKKIILGNWDYSPFVDLELVWGQEFADIIAERGHLSAEKIRACGAFAFDPYFRPESKRNTNHDKTVLFATGFSAADCRSEYCECGLPEESDYHKNLYKLHRNARDIWLDAIAKLVKQYSDWKFELKVRPGEVETEYRKKLPACVKIHPSDSTSSVVLRDIDVLVHSGSTMAIETHLLGIPSFNFCNVNPDPILSKVSPTVETYEELELNLFSVDVWQSNINKDVLNYLQEHLYGIIDGNACQRAAGFIHEHISNKKIETNIPNTWPKEILYLTDGVHITRQNGDINWFCPCCRNEYYAKPIGVTHCPYCSMQIQIDNAVQECVAK